MKQLNFIWSAQRQGGRDMTERKNRNIEIDWQRMYVMREVIHDNKNEKEEEKQRGRNCMTAEDLRSNKQFYVTYLAQILVVQVMHSILGANIWRTAFMVLAPLKAW